MNTNQRTTVVGVFDNSQDAQNAVNELKRAGFRDDQIGVASHHRDGSTSSGNLTGDADDSNVGTGAMTGALAGAGVGAAWGLGIVAGLLPAIGPVIAGGTLAAILASAGLGATAAGLAGALIGMGIPEDEAEHYESEFKAGRTIVTVRAENRYSEAEAIMRRCKGCDYANRGSHTAHTAGSQTTSHTGTQQSMKLHEEQAQVHKHPVQTGEARVRKEVHTEHKTIDVPVRKEEVVIERHPVSGQQATSGSIRAGEEIRIPVMEEQVDVQKRTVVKEEVNIGKREVEDHERVTTDLRKEDVKVEKAGDVDLQERSKRRS